MLGVPTVLLTYFLNPSTPVHSFLVVLVFVSLLCVLNLVGYRVILDCLLSMNMTRTHHPCDWLICITVLHYYEVLQCYEVLRTTIYFTYSYGQKTGTPCFLCCVVIVPIPHALHTESTLCYSNYCLTVRVIELFRSRFYTTGFSSLVVRSLSPVFSTISPPHKLLVGNFGVLLYGGYTTAQG